MASAQTEDEQKLAAMQLKIDAMEVELQRLVAKYNSHAAAHEETKVVKKCCFAATCES